MSKQPPGLVLIDLDGTLVDSVPDLAWCADRMLEMLGMPQRGEDAVRNWVGNGVERLVRRSLVNRLDGEPDAELFARAYPIFLDLYAAHNSDRSRVYPGVREGIEHLKSLAVRLGCVTNKAARFTIPLLRKVGLHDEFELIISGDDLPRSKPDPLPLLHAAEYFNVDPSQALFVGDSISDVRAARGAGYQVFCVSYGYNHGRDIREAEPDAVIDSLAELKTLLSRH